MPVYMHAGKTYNIPDSLSEKFESEHPEAKVTIYGSGKRYNIPIGKQAKFKQSFADWSYGDGAQQPKLSTQVRQAQQPQPVAEIKPQAVHPEEEFVMSEAAVASMPQGHSSQGATVPAQQIQTQKAGSPQVQPVVDGYGMPIGPQVSTKEDMPQTKWLPEQADRARQMMKEESGEDIMNYIPALFRQMKEDEWGEKRTDGELLAEWLNMDEKQQQDIVSKGRERYAEAMKYYTSTYPQEEQRQKLNAEYKAGTLGGSSAAGRTQAYKAMTSHNEAAAPWIEADKKKWSTQDAKAFREETISETMHDPYATVPESYREYATKAWGKKGSEDAYFTAWMNLSNKERKDWLHRDQVKALFDGDGVQRIQSIRTRADEKAPGFWQRTAEARKEHPWMGSEFSMSEGMYRDATDINQQTVRAIDKAEEMKQAYKNHQGDENFFVGAFKGLKDGITDVDTWTGVYMLGEMNLLHSIVDKMNKGEKLTQDEEDYFEAQAYKMAVEAALADDLGWGYGSGKTTAVSIPMMLQMIATGGGGLATKGVDKVAAKIGERAVKGYGKTILKRMLMKGVGKGATRALTLASRVPLAFADGAVQTTIWQSDKVVADAVRRSTGTKELAKKAGEMFGIEIEGKEAEDFGKALSKSFALYAAENGTEFLGNAFLDPLGDWMGKGIKKVVKGTKVYDDFAQVITSARRTGAGAALYDVATMGDSPFIKELMGKAQWTGLLGEGVEEKINEGINILMGEAEEEDFFDLEKNAQMLLGLSWTSLAFGVANGYSRTRAYAKIKKELDSAEKIGTLAFTAKEGEQLQETWEDFKGRIDQMSYPQLKHALSELSAEWRAAESGTISRDRAEAQLRYIMGRGQLLGFAAADSQAEMQNPFTEEQQEIDEATGEGINADEQTQKTITEERNIAEQALYDQIGEDVDEFVARYGETSDQQLQGIRTDESLSDEVRDIAENYVVTNAKFNGVVEAAEAEIEQAEQAAQREVETNANMDKEQVVRVTVDRVGEDGMTMEPTGAYVVQGDALGEDGVYDGSTVLQIRYADGMTEQVSASNVKVESVHPLQEMIDAAREGARMETINAVSTRMQNSVPTGADEVMQPGQRVTLEDGRAGVVESFDGVQMYQVKMDDGSNVVAPASVLRDEAAAQSAAQITAQAQENVKHSIAGRRGKRMSRQARMQQQSQSPTLADVRAQQQDMAAEQTSPQTATEQIPISETGARAYEQAEPSLAWQSLVEQSGGDAQIAESALMSTIRQKEDALRQLESEAVAAGNSIEETIAAQTQHKARVEAAKADLAKWQAIAKVNQDAKAEALQESNKKAAAESNAQIDVNKVAEETGADAKEVKRLVDLCSALGVKVQFEGYTTTDGTSQGHLTNASVDTGSRTITISKLQMAKGTGIHFILGHELTHQIKTDGNKELWGKYLESVVNAVGIEAFQAKLASMSMTYMQAGAYQNMTMEEFREAMQEEVCADFAGEAVFSPGNVKKFLGVEPTLIEKITGKIQEMFDTIRKKIYGFSMPQDIAYAAEQWQQLAEGKELTEQTGAETRHSLVGTTGARALDKAEGTTVRMDNMDVAEEMEAAGKDAETIWLATGWERGADGKWRYDANDYIPEFVDNTAKKQVYEDLIDAKIKEYESATNPTERHELRMKIGEYMDKSKELNQYFAADILGEEHPLIKAYPDLGNITIEFNPNTENCAYYPQIDQIELGTKNEDAKQNARNLAHELQHAVQHAEGFATGASTSNLNERLRKKFDAITAQIEQLRAEGRNEEADALIKQNKGIAEAVINNEGDVFGNYMKVAGEVEARNASARQEMSPEERRQTRPSKSEDVAREEQIVLEDESGKNEMGSDAHTLFEVIQTLYSQGKEVASRLYQRSYFFVAKTPEFMKKYGLRGDKFTIKYGVISRHFGKDESHDITKEEWRLLPNAIQEPFGITKIEGKTDSYRIYTPLKNKKGEYIAVGVDVKNAGRDIEVNAITTAFGRRKDGNLPADETVIYRSPKITPEQSSLLERPNSAQYTTAQELSASKGTQSVPAEQTDKEESSVKSAESNVEVTNEEVARDKRFSIANRNQEIFVSNAARAVEGIEQEKALPQQWLAMIEKNGGLKAGEDKWLGLSDWLKGMDKKSITKQEILDFIEENMIQIEEVHYGENSQGGYEKLDEEILGLWREAEGNNYDKAEQVQNILNDRYDGFADAAEIWYDGSLRVKNEGALAEILGEDRPINSTRLEYTTKGLENKREIALTVPTIEPWNKGDEIHFGEAGEGRAVAWVRFGETTDAEGKRVLVIDEIQSNRHQEGREKGYKQNVIVKGLVGNYEKVTDKLAYADVTKENGIMIGRIMRQNGKYVALDHRRQRIDFARYNTESEALTKVEENAGRDIDPTHVPDAPFDKNWHELAMKRMLRLAAEEGLDKVAWTTGAQQAERYDIGNVVNRIESNDTVDYDSTLGVDLVKQVVLFTRYGNAITLRLTPEGIVRASSQYNGHHISDIVGKELGNRIMAETDLVLKEQDLRIGGEGMKGFYDKMLPSFMNKYGKKWGAKVGEVTLPNLEESAQHMWAVDITPEMKESVMQGQVMFSLSTEEQSIVDAAKANGTYMKAPNGEPTNLNEKQWAQVRTKAFKEWFGDWENDPENASKIVDENGEPMVATHGTSKEFYEFDPNTQGKHDAGWLGSGFYFFTKNREYSQGYARGGRVMDVFLNIRDPYYASADEFYELAQYDNRAVSEEFSRNLIKEGYDGVYYDGDLNGETVAFSPNQIKSATDNVGTFDAENADIRYSMPGHSVASRIYGHPFTGAWQKFLQRAPKGVLKPGYGIIDESRLPEFADWYRMLVPEAEEYKEFVSLFLEDATATEKKHIHSVMDRVDKIVDDYRRLAEGDNSVLSLENNARFSITPDILAANERFNEELDEYIKKGIKANFVFHIGQPLGVMKLFFPELPIVMRPRVINKASNTKHDVDAASLYNLPQYIAEPIFVFQREDGAIGILTEMMDNNGKNVCVAVELNKKIQDGGTYLNVNDIRSIHGRDVKNIVLPIIHNNTLKYADKEKALEWFSSASSIYQQEITSQELSDATKIVQDFQNPPLPEDESSQNVENATSGEQKYSLPARPATPKRNEGEGIMAYAERVARVLKEQRTWDRKHKDSVEGMKDIEKMLEEMDADGVIADKKAIAQLYARYEAAKARAKENRRKHGAELREARKKLNALVKKQGNAQDKIADLLERYENWKTLRDKVRSALDNKNLSSINKSTLMAMLKAMGTATEANTEELSEMDAILAEIEIKTAKTEISEMLDEKRRKLNSKGMAVGKGVDLDTQKVLDMTKKNLSDLTTDKMQEEITKLRSENWHLRRDQEGEYADMAEEQKQERIAQNNEKIRKLREDLETELRSRSTKTVEEVEAELRELTEREEEWDERDYLVYQALQFKKQMADFNEAEKAAIEFEHEIDKKAAEASDLYRQMRQSGISNEEKEDLKQKYSEAKRIIAAMQQSLIEQKQIQAEKTKSFAEDLKEYIANGHAKYKEELEMQKERKKELVRKAMHDITGTGKRPQSVNTGKENKSEKPAWYKWIFDGSLSSLDYMLKKVSTRTFGRDSWLYQHFISGPNGVIAANDTKIQGLYAAKNALEEKAQELFGMSYEEKMRKDSKEGDLGIEIVAYPMDRFGEPEMMPLKLSKGQATYIYMVWKMSDGKMKLSAQGFNQDMIDVIEDYIGPRNVEWAEWVQEEYLPTLREKYNSRYEEMYGTSLGAIEHYVPLKIQGQSIRQEIDLEQESPATSLSAKHGSLIQRTRNVNPVDISTNAMEMLVEHITDMEEFYAYAPVRRDLQHILSSTAFHNQLNANTPGDFKRLVDAAKIAVGLYGGREAANDRIQKIWTSLQKGWISANIAFRDMTAIKQALAAPSFLSYSQDPAYVAHLMKNIGMVYGRNIPGLLIPTLPFGEFLLNPVMKKADKRGGIASKLMGETFQWCIDNFPDFKERVMKGSAGDLRLEDKGLSQWLDKLTEIGMSYNAFVDALTCAVGIKSIYDYEMGRARKKYDDLARDLGMTEEWKQRRMKEAEHMARLNATLYYNQTQQSGHNALLAPLQVSSNALLRSLALYKNSSLSNVRMAKEGWDDMLRYWGNKRMRNKMIEEYTRRMMEEYELEEDEARKRAIDYCRSQVRKAAFRFGMHGYVLNLLWNAGSKGMLGFWAGKALMAVLTGIEPDGDDEETPIIKEGTDMLMYWAAMPISGTIVGDLIENRSSTEDMAIGLMPENLADLAKECSKIYEDEGLSTNLLLAGLKHAAVFGGIDVETWANSMDGYYRLVADTGNNDERLLALMLVLNSPRSNRMAVARELYKGASEEEFQKAIELAGRYNRPAWAYGREMTDKVKSDMINWYIEDNMPPEEAERAKEVRKWKARIEAAKTIDEARALYDEAPDMAIKEMVQQRMNKIANPTQEKTFEEKVESKKKDIYAMEDEQYKYYQEVCEGTDVAEDIALREKIKQYAPAWNEYVASPERSKVMERRGSEILKYRMLSKYRSNINKAKAILDRNKDKSQLGRIRKMRKEALAM